MPVIIIVNTTCYLQRRLKVNTKKQKLNLTQNIAFTRVIYSFMFDEQGQVGL